MPTIEQIRAARALLDWSQKDLADHAGLSQTGIARIENGSHQPNSATLDKITNAFDLAEVEFLGNTGLRKRPGEIQILKGQDGFRTFMDDVYETAKKTGGEFCLFNGLPTELQKVLGDEWYEQHAQRMMDIKDNYDFKVTVKEGEKLLIGKNFATYRYFPEEMFHNRTIYVYGKKIAFMHFSEENRRVLVLKQPEIADSFRVLFNIAWNNVAIEPKQKRKEA